MYNTYFVNVSSLALPHGVFLKGQPVKLQDDSYTKELLRDGVLSSKPLLQEVERVINVKPVEDQAPAPVEVVAEPAIVEVQSTDTTLNDTANSPASEDESAEAAPKQPARRKRNGRRKRGSERSS